MHIRAQYRYRHTYLGGAVIEVRVEFVNDPAKLGDRVQADLVRFPADPEHPVQEEDPHQRLHHGRLGRGGGSCGCSCGCRRHPPDNECRGLPDYITLVAVRSPLDASFRCARGWLCTSVLFRLPAPKRNKRGCEWEDFTATTRTSLVAVPTCRRVSLRNRLCASSYNYPVVELLVLLKRETYCSTGARW
jgi:hypothetical protein